MRPNNLSWYALLFAACLLQATSCSLRSASDCSSGSECDSDSFTRHDGAPARKDGGPSSLIQGLAEEELGRSSTQAEAIPSSSETNYHFLRGDIAYNNHDFDQAFNYYKQAAEDELRPAPILRERLVELYVRNGDLPNALAELDRMMEGDQVTSDILELRGLIQIGLRKNDNALETYTALRQKYNVRSEDTAIITGALQIALNRPADAVASLGAWVHENPNSFLGFYYLGKALLKSDNLKDAEVAFRSAVTLRPVPAPILIDYARLLLAIGKPNDAKTIISKLLESNIDNDDVEALAKDLEDAEDGKNIEMRGQFSDKLLPLDAVVHTAMLRFESRDFFGAQASLLVAIAADPQNARAHYYLGSALLAIQEIDDSIEELLKIQVNQMFFEDSRTLAAYLLQGRKEYSRAIAVMKELTNARPENPRLLNLLATIYKQAGDLENAGKTLEAVVKLVPNDDKLLFSLGVIYDELGRKTEAIAMMRMALTINQDNANALNYLAYTYAELGTNLDEALALVQKALLIEPENGYYLDTLGWIYFRMAKYSDALREMQKSVKLTPNDAVILEHLARVQLSMGQTAEAKVTLQKALDNATDADEKGIPDRIRSILNSLN